MGQHEIVGVEFFVHWQLVRLGANGLLVVVTQKKGGNSQAVNFEVPSQLEFGARKSIGVD